MQIRTNGSWASYNYSIMEENAATVENSKTIPIYSNSSNLVDYSFEGQCSQASTPSPSDPVEVEEFGDRTENLFDSTATRIIGSSGDVWEISDCDPTKPYTCSTSLAKPSGATAASIYFDNKLSGATAAINGVWANQTRTFYPSQDGKMYIHVRKTAGGGAPAVLDEVLDGTITIMFNEGDSSIPYIPYGETRYDIPIVSANQTQNIILNEPLCKIGTYADSVNSEGVVTRRIGKYEITGQENWLSYPQASYGAYITLSDMMANGRANGLSNCFKAQVTPASSAIDGITFGAGTSNKVLYITFSSASASALNITDITSIKTWLTQQYTNGTPVTVYYVLATPTTESYSKNIFTPAAVQTTTLNGVTCVSDGQGRYSLSGTATADSIIEFDIPEFTAPVSVGQGGNGTFSLFNNFAKDYVWFKLRNNNTEIDNWYCSTSNRRNNTYVAMSNKLINKIQIVFYSGVSFAPGSIISPMFSHDSTYPTAFEPYTLPPTIPTSSGFSKIEIGTSMAPSKFEYDLGKMFVPHTEKIRVNGAWV